MKSLLFWLSIILIISTQQKNTISELYSKFLDDSRNHNFYQLGTRLKLQDDFSNLLLIDTIYLRPLSLIDTVSKSKEYGLPNLIEYNCRLLSIFRSPNYDCIITHSYTTSAGDGNPILHVATFSKKGKQISSVKYLIVNQHDYTPIPEQYFTMDDENKVTFELIERNFEIADSLGTEVLRYINTKDANQYYSI